MQRHVTSYLHEEERKENGSGEKATGSGDVRGINGGCHRTSCLC